MGIKRHSIQTLAAKGFIPSVIYAAQNPNRIVNPLWNFTLPYTFQGTVSGYTSGGRNSTSPPEVTNRIDKFPFATNANATDVGDLTLERRAVTGQSSDVSGYTSGGYPSGGYVPPGIPPSVNIIDKFPFAADANATDVGDLLSRRNSLAGQSSSVSGYVSGSSNVIEKFPFASNGNATDVGDLTVGRSGAGQSSTENGYTSGGSSSNVIDKFPFATDANATDVGDLTVGRVQSAGQSSSTNGYTSGGNPGPGSLGGIIDKFPFASNSNATDVGDLSSGAGAYGTGYTGPAGQSSETHGYSSGGNLFVQSLQNIVDRFSFASDGNATDVGDLTMARAFAAGQQN